APHCRYTDDNRQYTDELSTCKLPPRHCEERSDEAIQNILAILDCFAEPVIGPTTSGRTRWLAMTGQELSFADFDFEKPQWRTTCPQNPKTSSPARSARSPAPSFWNRCATTAKSISTASALRTSPRIRRFATRRLQWRCSTTRCTTKSGMTCSPRRPTQ